MKLLRWRPLCLGMELVLFFVFLYCSYRVFICVVKLLSFNGKWQLHVDMKTEPFKSIISISYMCKPMCNGQLIDVGKKDLCMPKDTILGLDVTRCITYYCSCNTGISQYVCAFRHLDTCTLCPPLQHEVLCLVTYEQLL